MPTAICLRCNRTTNTATSDHIYAPDGKADRCFAAYVDDKWVSGCAAEDTDIVARMGMDMVQHLLKEEE